MTRTGSAALLAVLLLGLAETLAPASAQQTQSIPLPTPAPPQRDRTGVAPKHSPLAGSLAQSAAPVARIVNPARPPLVPVVSQGGALDKDQRVVLDRVSNYLSGIRYLSGKFVQVGPDGSRTTGDFYLQKPGKVRFEYDPPTPIEIVANGQDVAIRNSKLATQDLYALSQTPLRYLLADRIDLMRDTNVIGVSVDDVFVTVVVEEHSKIVGTNRLMMMFAAKDLQLKQWTITDPQGYDTTVAVYDLDLARRPDPNLFTINYDRPDRSLQ
jgi:outer membrane lipoprotein-sorting protein